VAGVDDGVVGQGVELRADAFGEEFEAAAGEVVAAD
jgi:hypothetical protein